MSKIPTTVYPFVLALVTLAAAGVIAGLGRTVPSQLWSLAYTFGGATIGVVIPQGVSAIKSSTANDPVA